MPTLPINSITINPDRQRTNLTNLDDLAASISQIGLINPIVVDMDGVLIAGERRLTACKQLGWTDVPVTIFEDLSPARQHMIELEENVRREELPWKDHCFAIARYHELCLETDPEWTQAQTAEALNISPSQLSERLAVTEALIAEDPLVTKADKYSVAKGIIIRQAQRKNAAATQEVASLVDEVSFGSQDGSPSPKDSLEGEGEELGEPSLPLGAPLMHGDFLTHTPDKTYTFIHCDFPYGIGADTHHGTAADKFGGYDDSEDVYWQLIARLGEWVENGWINPSAHMMFWFSMNHYTETIQKLTSQGWAVNPHPLVWAKSDNTGILPDPKRGPRRTYETAFLCTLGDLFIVQPVANVYHGPAVPKAKRIHMSEKPVEMFQHFFRMFVDESTTMFDPTAGSGNSLRAALRSGAATAEGLELDKEFYEAAIAIPFTK